MRSLFSKLPFIKMSFRNTIRVSNGLDPDQDQTAFKGYQQMIKVAASRQRNNNLSVCITQAVLSRIDNCKGGSWVIHQSFATMGPHRPGGITLLKHSQA